MNGVFEIVLADDSRLAPPDGPAEAARPFVPPFAPPTLDGQEAALAMWINAHQLFFLLLCAGTSAAEGAARALAEGRLPEVCAHIDALTALRRASTALTDAAGGIAPEAYETFIRPTMASMRSDFSGVSSRDNWRFDDAMKVLAASVASALAAPRDADDERLAAAWRAQEEATRAWWELHAVVMRRLVGDPTSLARLAYDKLVAGGLRDSFRDFQKVLRSPAALDTNDEFFAVRRGDATRATHFAALERLESWLEPRLSPGVRVSVARGADAARALLDRARAST